MCQVMFYNDIKITIKHKFNMSLTVKKKRFKNTKPQYLRNRNKNCCRKMSARVVFPQLFQVLPNFHLCFLNLIETLRTCFLFLHKIPQHTQKNQLVYFDNQTVNSLCSRHHHINSSCQFCVSVRLQKHGFKPINMCILLGLFSKIRCEMCTIINCTFYNFIYQHF